MHNYYDSKTHTNFNYNGDLSGDVHIKPLNSPEFKVNGESLMRFIAEWVRISRIGELEDMSPEEILGVGPSVSVQINDAIERHEESQH